MQTSFRKLSVQEIFELRDFRKTHSRTETAEKYGVSVQWVSQCMTMSDAEIISSLSPNKSKDDVTAILDRYGLAPCMMEAKQLVFKYNKGRFSGLFTYVSPYYLLETDFEPSFQTLTDASKKTYIKRLLKEKGANKVSIARVGDDEGIKNTYEATVDGSKVHWKKLAQLLFN